MAYDPDYDIKQDLYVLIHDEFHVVKLTNYNRFKYCEKDTSIISENIDPMGTAKFIWVELPIKEYKVGKYKKYYVAFENSIKNATRVENYFNLKEKLALK